VGPQTRWLLSLKAPLWPLSLSPSSPSPQRAPTLPSTPGRSTPDGLQKGPNIGEVRQGSHGVIPQPSVIIAAVIVLPRDCLGGRLLEWEPVKALLATTLLQCLLLEGLVDFTLLGSVFLLLLLGRQEASSLPSDPIFRNRRPCFLDRR
jgi:hypothetical protein